MNTLRGTAASPGVAIGPVVVVEALHSPTGRTTEPDEIPAELDRLARASAMAATELDRLAEQVTAGGHADEGGIFAAQAAMARDPALASLAEDEIRSGVDVVAGVLAAAAGLAGQLREIGDDLLAERAADVLDVGERIARRAAGIPDPGAPSLERPSIVVATDLAPSVTATLPRDRLLGFALESGSATAHAAILARAFGIPAVVGVAGLLAALPGDARRGAGDLALDGATGEVFVAPDAATLSELARRAGVARTADAAALAEAGLPAVTTDGVGVALLANIGTPGEAARAVALGARGVGLFRTEFLFLERPAAPSEDEQLAAYRDVVEAFAPDPVTIRLLDIGGDKPIPWLQLPSEANPFLGVRAIRLAAMRPDLFVTQLRAAMRAAVPIADDAAAAPGTAPVAAARVKVMAPMVADADDASTLIRLADRAREELTAAGVPHGDVELGVMLEIPSAILVGDTYLGRLAFGSLGTNDLLQYALAVDRGNPALARYQDSLHPALLRLVREAVERSERAGIELSVCGEMAGDPAAALALVGLGIRTLSMVPGSLAAVRRAIRSAESSVLRREADAALGDGSSATVRARFGRLVLG
jgi:phosphoenolpyruvate-protein phosphotransferase